MKSKMAIFTIYDLLQGLNRLSSPRNDSELEREWAETEPPPANSFQQSVAVPLASTLPLNSANVPLSNDIPLQPDEPPPVNPPGAPTNPSGDYQIDGILSPYKWGFTWEGNGANPPNQITYSFYLNGVSGTYYGTETVSEVSNPVKDNVREIMNWLSNAINVDFVEVTETANTYGRIRWLNSSAPNYAYAYYPTEDTLASTAGDIHLRSSYDYAGETNGFQNPAGKHGYATLIHELGHALGLKHSFETPALPASEDKQTNTVMTYNFDNNEPGTFMRYDLKALQYLYGARAYNTGDTTYQFSDRIDQFSVNSQLFLNTPFSTKQLIWDSGGNDTLNFSQLALNANGYRFDLTLGGLLSSQTAYNATNNTISIGTELAYNFDPNFNALMENVVNSSSNDTIYLNSAANTVSGYSNVIGNGNDILWNATNQDTLNLSNYSSAAVSRTQNGTDWVLGLGSKGSVTLKDFYGGNMPAIIYSDRVEDTFITINDASISEGNTGTSNLIFNVNLSRVSSQSVSVNYATADDTAVAGSDYTTTSGTLTFASGQTSQTIAVPIIGDILSEDYETFLVNLSGATNATIANSQSIGTIEDDDFLLLSINDVSVTEGNSGTKNAIFTVSLTSANSEPVSVNYATADGTAVAGSDYTTTSGILTFAAGQTSQTIAVPIIGDILSEINETFFLNLSGATNAVITDSQGMGTIQDDDFGLSINDVSVTEGNSGSKNATFTVSLSKASTQTVTVKYATADGTATTGNKDYTATSNTLTFNPGETSKLVSVVVTGDTVGEYNEQFFVNLSSPTNTTIDDTQGMGTIVNDDPALIINDVSIIEGDSGTTNATFTVSLTATTTNTVSVSYATANGTATSGSDYTAKSGTLSFAPGVTSQTVSVPVVGDTAVEANETFFVNLSSNKNATLLDKQGVGTIIDDDRKLSINDVSITEGDSGTKNALFTVTLSQASSSVVTVNYATANGTATAGSDYTATTGTLTFAANQTSQTINVPIIGDTLSEANETFLVNLSNANGAFMADSQGVGTIVDDEPSFSISDVSITEGNSGTTNAAFTVTLSKASSQSLSLNWATADNTATAGSDYTAGSGTLTFAPSETSKIINVAVLGDTLAEANEIFFVNLSNVVGSAGIADGQGVGTIGDDEPRISINDVSVTEGNSGTTNAAFTVSLSSASSGTVTVNYGTADGTATAGSDYTAGSGTLTFAPGVTSQTVNVPVIGDTLSELNETFFLNLSNATTNAFIADSQGVGTIVDDDPIQIAINDVSLSEGNSGTINAVFTVSLSRASTQTITVGYATADGTATTGNKDYTAKSGTLTFAAGVTSQTVSVAVTGDTVGEYDENFFVNLSNPSNAIIGDGKGVGTIINNDPALIINDVSITEGNSGTTNANFTVTLTAPSTNIVSVSYATANGTATSGSDYTAKSGSLSFAVGETSKTVSVPVTGDTVVEANETFFVNLSSNKNATLLDTQGIGTIVNDDPGSSPPSSVPLSVINGSNDADTLQGTPADDQITGLGGSDVLNGREGSDLLIGVDLNTDVPGLGEIDTLTGGLGADFLALGDATQTYYDDGNDTNSGYGDYGLVVGFNASEGDIIQLHGLAADYSFLPASSGLPPGTAIFLKTGGVDELVGIVQDVPPSSIANNAIAYVTNLIANADAAIAPQNTAVNIPVLANDSDPLAIDSFTQGTHGSITLNNNTTPTNTRDDFLTYTPNNGFQGSDTFTYTVADGNGATASATVSLVVKSPFSEVFDSATGKFKLGEALNFTAFALANNPSGNEFALSNSLTTVDGTIALGSGSKQNFSGPPQVTGDYFSDPLAQSVNPSQVNLLGSAIGENLTQAETDVENLAAKAIALTPTQTFSKFSGGETVSAASLGANSPSYNVIRIPNIDLSGSKTVTIQGEADDFFLIQLFDPAPGSKLASLKMSGTSQIVLSGGLKRENLLWYVEGQVTMSGSAIARGTFLAFDPENQFVNDVSLNGAAIEGQIFANSISLTGGAQITGVPVKTIYGTANADSLTGTTGDDGIFGRPGDDIIRGLTGNDRLEGGSGNDQLEGNEGNDTLLGGLGDDSLLGGDGSDIFVLAPAEGTDTVVDFTPGSDLLSLSGGLSFESLTFSNNYILFGSAVLATLTGINTTTLTYSNFLAA